jgi:hypothetical protein
MLRRTSRVDEYSKRFIALFCRDTTLFEPQQIQLFITGLGDPLCTDVVLQQPASLDNVVIFALTYEQRNVSREPVLSQPDHRTANSKHYRSDARLTTFVNKLASSSIRLSPFEVAQHHKDVKCFKCDELFTLGHHQQCK